MPQETADKTITLFTYIKAKFAIMSKSIVHTTILETTRVPHRLYTTLSTRLCVENSAPQSLMASTSKDPVLLSLVQESDVPTPWCDEYERMVSGMAYSSGKSELMLNHKLQVRRLLLGFNDPTIPANITYHGLQAQRMDFAKKIFGKVGVETNIDAPLFCNWGCNTQIGDNVYINKNISIFDSAPVLIGHRCLIGPEVTITTESHGTDITPRRNHHGFAKPVIIGDDCWIGAGVKILPGVTIGRGCTIGAGAVVCRDIPECSVAVGMPARVIKKVRDPDLEFGI